MKKITLQDIFNAAWEAFIVKDLPPATEFGIGDSNIYQCSYITDCGNRCAVGLVLPEAVAKESIGSFFTVWNDYPELFDLEFPSDLETDSDRQLFLNQFQGMLHDNLIDHNHGGWYYSLEKRKQEYIQTALNYNLQIPS